MPMIRLTREQFIAAVEERLKEANASAVLTNLSGAFMRFAEMHDGRAEFFPDVAAEVSSMLAEMAKTVGQVEDGSKSLKPARKRKAKAIPPCAAAMGCLCWAHANGAKVAAPCNATQTPPIRR